MDKSACDNMTEIDRIIDVFKALSDRTRLRIIWLFIKSKKWLCVCEIVDSLAENQYNVSRHLKILKNAGLVECKEMGRWTYYYFKKPENKFYNIIQRAISEIPKEVFYQDDLRLEKRLSMRKNGWCVIGMNSKEWETIIKKLKSKFKNNLI
ncbi:MAG: metalloregulator ArsR/SmtB family transcription factor [Candidatus Omnitrophica bacterium]|nr:metalloregulator ArsR/SmtB family transcription factor [Candidatus Omnitrophota bacterium]